MFNPPRCPVVRLKFPAVATGPSEAIVRYSQGAAARELECNGPRDCVGTERGCVTCGFTACGTGECPCMGRVACASYPLDDVIDFTAPRKLTLLEKGREILYIETSRGVRRLLRKRTS